MKKYRQNPSEPWPFLNDEERDKCCKKEEPGAAAGQPQGCVDDWKQKLGEARKTMEEAAARHDKAKKTYSNAASWEGKLKKWKEDAEAAHERACEVYDELGLFLKAVVRTKTVETAKAVEAVLCLVKSIFDDVNELLRVSNSAEEPKGEIQELRQRIECDESLDVNIKEKALSRILPFEDQMKVVYGAQKDLLNKLLEILHCANVIVAAVEKPGAQENVGLKWQLEDLYNRISGKTVYTAGAAMCGGGEEPPSPEPPCERDNVDPPEPFFPIRKSVYYSGLVKLYEEAKTKSKDTKQQMADARETLDAALLRYNGLNDAIKAAEAAKPAK